MGKKMINDKKLTICYLGTAGSIHTVKWAEYFANKGHKVHLISYDDFRDKKSEKIILHLIGRKIPINLWRINTLINLPLALSQTKKLIKEIRPDIIHAHYVTSYGHLAALTGFKPIIMTGWGSDILVEPKKSIISRIAVKYALKRSALITCDAEHMKKAIIKLGGDSCKIKVIRFGIDTGKFFRKDKNEKLQEKLGTLGILTVISLRRPAPIYNLETLIRAIPSVIKEFPDVKFLIAGEGSEKERLKKMAEELNIIKNVLFIGEILNDALPDYLNISDVYVSTSLSDAGISSSTAEAMACGLPVIVTDSGENKNWINDGESGFIIPVKSPEILSEKIIYLLKNPKKMENFGENARKMIIENNDYCNEMTKMEKLYHNALQLNN